jgi:hypothetical protein
MIAKTVIAALLKAGCDYVVNHLTKKGQISMSIDNSTKKHCCGKSGCKPQTTAKELETSNEEVVTSEEQPVVPKESETIVE